MKPPIQCRWDSDALRGSSAVRVMSGLGVRIALGIAMSGVLSAPLIAKPYLPADDARVLAELPAGAHHAELSARRLARGRLDVAVPLAKFYIAQARASGDLRFLGYAESVLAPWVAPSAPAAPAALVLQATIQQSRHEFTAALGTLDRSLAVLPSDPQAWLTRATVLRVLGRYPEAQAACREFARWADRAVSLICEQSLAGLAGHLDSAYTALAALSVQDLTPPERAWRESELGEMAVRLGRDAEAERWFRQALTENPEDFYVRAAYADLLLRAHRDDAVRTLLKGQESIEPLLLRLAIAEQRLRDPNFAHSREQLQAAFGAETARGEAVHRREQARFLLEVQDQPDAALSAALANWDVQREPDDALILVTAAHAAGTPERAAPAIAFARAQGLHDVRLAAAQGTGS
jgi:tetratricopeptide (TPR) repeat protein